MPALLIVAVLIGRFRANSNEVQRVSESHAAVFHLFVELMSGLTTVRACYADPLLYRNFRRELDADGKAVQSAARQQQWLFFWAECVAGMVLSLTAVGVAALRNSDRLLPNEASFLLLNTVFTNVIIYLFVTHHIELANLAAHRRRIVAATPAREPTAAIDDGGVLNQVIEHLHVLLFLS